MRGYQDLAQIGTGDILNDLGVDNIRELIQVLVEGGVCHFAYGQLSIGLNPPSQVGDIPVLRGGVREAAQGAGAEHQAPTGVSVESVGTTHSRGAAQTDSSGLAEPRDGWRNPLLWPQQNGRVLRLDGTLE